SGRFTNIPTAPNSDGIGGPGQSTGHVGGSSSARTETETAEVVKAEPPPIVNAEPMRTTIKSEGVINGKATFLPNPAYPKPAQMVGAYGIVNVQVTIDESGKVISSKAVSGHPLLRGTAESAAWKAKFSPTYLSKVPVKVTGVIVFNFKRS
ncbi:MAG: energy transducer TonB, partial [Pyrinomonadaceae bacterium]